MRKKNQKYFQKSGKKLEKKKVLWYNFFVKEKRKNSKKVLKILLKKGDANDKLLNNKEILQ